MVDRYTDYLKRLKGLDYDDPVCNVVIGAIRIAEENITTPSTYGLSVEIQKMIEKEVNGGDDNDN